MKLVILLGIASAISGAQDPAPTAQRSVALCVEGFHDVLIVGPAMDLVRNIYGKIGVTVSWHYKGRSCPADAILVNLREDTPESLQPGALGYAILSEGHSRCHAA